MTFADKRFAVGDHVHVLDLGKPGHVRIPMYIRHHTGRVVQYCGKYLNPEDLSVGRTEGPAVDLYRVVFAQSDLWSDDPVAPNDMLVIEIYDHWLERA
ncbi:SH3-like domain-containing protein [Roseovarius sp. CAU 1744]|uniref:SH3-like domain-containing protein n=1 Tax=Roseovarius sp. CAU 1744 TaxID=3140368 RepID=UPI00325C18AD